MDKYAYCFLIVIFCSVLCHSQVRQFERVVLLETTSETSANASFGDLDHDGDLDIVLAKGRHWPLHDRVLFNNGKGEFTAGQNLGETPDKTYSAILIDLDGDGDLDVVVSNDKPDKKLIYFNDGKGNFRVAGTWGNPLWSTRNASTADLNGDEKPDIIAANRPGPSYFCLNDGHGAFPEKDCFPIPAPSATSIVAADFNGCLLYTSPSPRDGLLSRMPSSA